MSFNQVLIALFLISFGICCDGVFTEAYVRSRGRVENWQ